MTLHDLEVYQLARELGKESWRIYRRFDWQTRKIIGDQWIEAVDSVGANIAEGFGRFHYLDKNKFNYNARGSLDEGMHWTELLGEREIITQEETQILLRRIAQLHVKLNNFILSTKNQVHS